MSHQRSIQTEIKISELISRMQESQWVTMYKRNAGFIAKLNNSSRKKILDKMKISSSKTRTTLILERWQQYKI